MMETVKLHYSEADLLETYYTQPGAAMPVMMHLAECESCAARYERLDKKMRALAACDHDRPETFWARQRIAVMRKIDARRSTSSVARVTRVAAAAVLVFALGSIVTWRIADVPRNELVHLTEPAALTTSTPVEELADAHATDSSDPWQSEELNDYQSMVAWESWVEKEDQSL